MVGALEVAGPGAPQGGSKDDHGQEEENAHDFQPQNAAYAAERAEKTAYAAGNVFCRLSGHLAGGAAWGGDAGGGLAWRGVGGGLGAGGGALAGDASCDAQADAQSAADGVGFHTVYDGSSDSQLPLNGDGSKVEESYAATSASSWRGPPLWRYP